MLIDASVNFWPVGSTIAVTNIPVRSNVVDLLGTGVGTAPQNIIGTRTMFGADVGIGMRKPQVEVGVGVAFAGGTSINIAFQGAIDSGVAGSYLPGAWQTFIETGAILTANMTLDALLAKFDFPPAFPEGFMPRYLSLLATPVGVFTAGSFRFGIVTMGRDDLTNRQAAKNFVVE